MEEVGPDPEDIGHQSTRSGRVGFPLNKFYLQSYHQEVQALPQGEEELSEFEEGRGED